MKLLKNYILLIMVVLDSRKSWTKDAKGGLKLQTGLKLKLIEIYMLVLEFWG